MYLSPFPFQSPTSRASISTPALVSTTLLLTTIIAPCKAYVDWLYPSSSSSNALAFNYNDVVYFTWDSNFSTPSIALWCARNDQYYSLYTANTTTNGTTPQSFPYADAFNQSCHMSLYCNKDSDPHCQPTGHPSPEFSLLHNHADVAQTWGLSATKELGKAAATSTSATGTGTGSATETLAAAKTAARTPAASASATGSAPTETAKSQGSGSGLSTGAKAGIGVGIAVGAIAVIAAVWICVARAMRKGREGDELTGRDGLGGPKMMSELEYSGHPSWVGPPRQEMDGEGKMGELGGTPQAELSSVASPVRYG